MASCITDYWSSGTSTPRVRLTVTQSSETGDTATLAWKLEYVASSAVSTSVKHACTASVNGTTVHSSSYAIGGKTGTYTIASGSTTVDKGTSSKSIPFSCSMDFTGITWSGTYKGAKETASGSITISAKTSYVVKYNANGGTGAPSNQTKWHDTTLTLSSTKPTRTGHTFQGWATSSSGSVAYTAGASYTKNAAVTLYAVWKANTYTVTYNANGGSGAPARQTKTYGKTLTLSNTKPTRTNYTFKGWGTSASTSTVSYAAGGSYTTNASITLYAVWELAYAKPRIAYAEAVRCGMSGDPRDDGTYAKVQFNWTTDKEVCSITISANSTSSTGDVIGIETAVSASGRIGIESVVIGDGQLSVEKTYTIVITISDSLSEGYSSSKSITLPGQKFTMDAKAGGDGIAFGKPAEMDNFADFGWDACFNNFLGIHGRDLEGNIKQVFQPQNENGNTTIGWDNYDMKSGYTNVYGHDVHIGVSNMASPDTFRPYRRQGDSLTFSNLRTAGYVTNAGKDVTFLVPFAVPIIGSPTATATSIQGFVLRQGESYTHGSSASTFVVPDSYTATPSAFCGVYIVAHFSDTTNVINNAPIGIYWSGKIEFEQLYDGGSSDDILG